MELRGSPGQSCAPSDRARYRDQVRPFAEPSAEARRAAIDALVAASPTLFAEDAGFLTRSSRNRDRDAPRTRCRRPRAAHLRRAGAVAGGHGARQAGPDPGGGRALGGRRDARLLDDARRPDRAAAGDAAHNASARIHTALGRRRARATIALDPLDAAAGARLLAAIVGDTSTPVRGANDPQKAGGVPLFVEELARTVLDAAPGLSAPGLFEALRFPRPCKTR